MVGCGLLELLRGNARFVAGWSLDVFGAISKLVRL